MLFHNLPDIRSPYILRCRRFERSDRWFVYFSFDDVYFLLQKRRGQCQHLRHRQRLIKCRPEVIVRNSRRVGQCL